MKLKITKSTARGRINAPPSKSMAHRLLISAAMCDGVSTVRGISSSSDVAATVDCLSALGVNIERVGEDVIVHGRKMTEAQPHGALKCRESGSTLRFMLPIAMLTGKTAMLTGAEGLMSRPMSVFEELARERGLGYLADGGSITVKGPLTPGEYTVVGNISSQFISGLLFALPNLAGDSRIRITPPIESRSYIDLTISALSRFGVRVVWEDEKTLYIKGGQSYTPTDVTVEGDWSGAAFPDAFNLFGGEVTVDGLDPESIQGDRAYPRYFEMLRRGVPTIHIGDCPDLGPILFAIAAAKNGGVFTGTARLKIKESDRAAAMAEELGKFGASVTVREDKVVVFPASFGAPREPLFGHNDHRIVMALSVLLTLTGGEIEGAEAVSKSYPEFFDHLRTLGVEVCECD